MNRRVEIARGWDLFRLGAFAEAESLLTPLIPEAEPTRILLWIAIRRNDAANKRFFGELLSQCEDPNLSAVGRAHENVALGTLNRNIKPWLRPVSKWAITEVAYARSLLSFGENRANEARDILAQALPQTAEQRVRYSQLRASSRGLEEDYERQAIMLIHSLGIAVEEKVDSTLMAAIADPLALLIREVELGDVGLRAEHLLERVIWPKDLPIHRFYAQRALAWRKSLRGDWIRAMDMLDKALAIAPDDMRRGLIHADRARIREHIPESLAAASSRAFAFQCFEALDWDTALGDEAMGVFGAMDVLRAEHERAIRLFRRAAEAISSRLSGTCQGRRSTAFEKFALSHLSGGDEAFQHTAEAYKVFKEIKYLHRAAGCALRAVELGGGARWRARVERLTTNYPRSLVASQYRRLTSPWRSLRGRMREIANLLANTDLSVKEIAPVLGITEATVRVHIRRIKKALNVETRVQLVRMQAEAFAPRLQAVVNDTQSDVSRASMNDEATRTALLQAMLRNARVC